MQLTRHAQTTLKTLFAASSQGTPMSRGELARILGSGDQALARTLVALDTLGLIDRARLRLTLPGLAVAVALSADADAADSASRASRHAA